MALHHGQNTASQVTLAHLEERVLRAKTKKEIKEAFIDHRAMLEQVAKLNKGKYTASYFKDFFKRLLK